MKAISVTAVFGVLLSALVLAAIAPWLNPCIGPLRFVDCAAYEESALPIAFAPWFICPFAICDYFPSAVDRAVRGLVVLLIVAGAAYAGSREASRAKFVSGLAAAAATCVLASILIGLVYVHSGN